MLDIGKKFPESKSNLNAKMKSQVEPKMLTLKDKKPPSSKNNDATTTSSLMSNRSRTTVGTERKAPMKQLEIPSLKPSSGRTSVLKTITVGEKISDLRKNQESSLDNRKLLTLDPSKY